jgi:hypothetical protein
MDLIYMNAAKEDLGVMQDFTFDMAFGVDENDFECRIVKERHCCMSGYYLYCDGTEYGGVIDKVGVDTRNGEITYSGRTWHGILNSKVLKPDSGANYLTASGEANTVLEVLISRMGLGGLFKASNDDSGINIASYQMDRYIGGYDGIMKMLKASGAKLNMSFNEGFVELSAKPIVDYSKDERFDSYTIDLNIKKVYNPLNHVVCLGKGDLAEREVIHVYADKYGNICDDQMLFDLDEVEGVYENANCESSEELRKGGVEKIEEAWKSTKVDFDFNSDAESYDVGDIVGSSERVTSIKVKTEITKKIVAIKGNTVTVSYDCGELATIGGNAVSAILGEAILGQMILGG